MLPSARRVAQLYLGSQRVARQWLRARDELDLKWYGLEGLTDGSTVILYHGTTKQFDRFDVSKSREELVKDYYGGGIFLTPKEPIAWSYAHANRNIGFDTDLIDDLKRVNPNAGAFLEDLYKLGDEAAWDKLVYETLADHHGDGMGEAMDRYFGRADPNRIGDLAPYIIGSKSKAVGASDELSEIMGIMGGGQSTGAPHWVYDTLDDIGLDGDKYRPKVYTVAVKGIHNPLITTKLSEARRARSKGYDAVVYHGSEAVRGVPEVAIFDPRKVKILRVEV